MNNSSSQQDQLRILGVFAHPDDESFCAGGTFARYTNAGAEAMVVLSRPTYFWVFRDFGEAVCARRNLVITQRN
jgi:hypothetical protein